MTPGEVVAFQRGIVRMTAVGRIFDLGLFAQPPRRGRFPRIKFLRCSAREHSYLAFPFPIEPEVLLTGS